MAKSIILFVVRSRLVCDPVVFLLLVEHALLRPGAWEADAFGSENRATLEANGDTPIRELARVRWVASVFGSAKSWAQPRQARQGPVGQGRRDGVTLWLPFELASMEAVPLHLHYTRTARRGGKKRRHHARRHLTNIGTSDPAHASRLPAPPRAQRTRNPNPTRKRGMTR